MKSAALAAVLSLLLSPVAFAQSIPSDAETPRCAVPRDFFKSWFENNDDVRDGFVTPANSLQLDIPGDCNFYQWAQRMFMWLTSPQPSKYGSGGRVFDSSLFFDVSARDPQTGERTFIPHFPGFTRLLNLRDAKAGPSGSPVLFDRNGRLVEVRQAQTGPNGRPLIRNRAGDLVEIGAATVGPDQKPIFTDLAGNRIEYQLSSTDPGYHPIEPGTVIPVDEFFVDGRVVLIDRNGTVREIGVGQADGGVQLAQNGSLVYYITMVNDVYAYFRTGVEKNRIITDKFPTANMDLKKVMDFAKMFGKQFLEPNVLVMEVKTAWVEAGGLRDLGSYITIDAMVPTFDRTNHAKWVPSGSKDVTLALVGMHVVGSAKGNPEMIWATFEHLGNAPNAAYSYYSTNGVKPVPQDSAGRWLFATSNLAPPFNLPNQKYAAPNICAISSNGHDCSASWTIRSSNTLRSKAWGGAADVPSTLDSNTDIISMNYSIKYMMPGGDVRDNYFMVGTTWTNSGEPPNSANQRGSSQLSNSTMETFQQGPDNTTSNGSSNCLVCHTSNQTSVSRIFNSLKPLF